MGDLPQSPGRKPRTQTLLLGLAKPLLHLHLGLYRRELASAPFPVDEPEFEDPGPHPDHLAFVGSIAVSGYGVLHHGMKTSSRTAQQVACERRRGCTWTEVTTPTLTAAGAAALPSLVPAGTDAVMLLIGITDVLLVTSPGDWGAALERIAERVRDEAGCATGVVVAGIPPMAEFRPIPPVAARRLTRQIDGLNAVSQELAERTPGMTYVPFPRWDVGSLFIQDAMSWATMHRLWASAVTPAVISLLDRRDALTTAAIARSVEEAVTPAVAAAASVAASAADSVAASVPGDLTDEPEARGALSEV